MSTAEVTQQEKPQPVKITTEQPTWTLVDALHTYVQNRPDQVVYFGIDMKGKEAKKYTSKQLLSRSEGVARGLLKHGVGLDDRVLLVFFPGTLDVCIAYFACVLVGAIPVCVFPPDPRRLKHEIPTFERSANDCGAKVVLTNTEYYRLAFRPLTGAKWPANITWVKVNDYKLENKKSTEPFPKLPKSNLAFIQYTSGSTSDPKGCMVSQANLLHNLTAITVAYTWNKGYRIASWLPHFHDMGLIGSLLVPVLQEGSAVVMSPLMFLSSPPLWIRLVSKYKCTHASTPNFGLVLAVRKSTAKDREGLDLSNVYFNCGAEPVRVSVVNNFIEMYKPYGFKPENMLISYGMAEHVLYITTSPYRDTWLTLDKNDFEQDKIRIVPREQASERTMTVSSCGFPSPSFDVKIVDPEKFVPLGEDLIGEVWLNSPSKVLGYWNHPELDGPVFNAKMEGSDAGYLRTGDYGFFHNGELYLCGRKKDLIIIGGRNYYPQDIELAVEGCDPNIRPGCVIAFEVELDENELQSIVVVCEVREAKKMRQEDFEKVTSAIYRTVLAAFQLACHQVILIDIHTLMKTTSGKVQRQPTKKKWLAGDLKSVYIKQFAAPKRDPVVEAANMEEETDPSTEQTTEEELKTAEQQE